jgi:hypothetical protein
VFQASFYPFLCGAIEPSATLLRIVLMQQLAHP